MLFLRSFQGTGHRRRKRQVLFHVRTGHPAMETQPLSLAPQGGQGTDRGLSQVRVGVTAMGLGQGPGKLGCGKLGLY